MKLGRGVRKCWTRVSVTECHADFLIYSFIFFFFCTSLSFRFPHWHRVLFRAQIFTTVGIQRVLERVCTQREYICRVTSYHEENPKTIKQQKTFSGLSERAIPNGLINKNTRLWSTWSTTIVRSEPLYYFCIRARFTRFNQTTFFIRKFFCFYVV